MRIKTKVGRPMDVTPTGPGTALANFLIDRLAELDLTNQEIADTLGYQRPNIISMWKAGRTKFTLDNVFPMADLLKVDPGYMLALYMDQYVSTSGGGVDRFPEIIAMVNRIATPEEWEIVEIARKARKGNSRPLTKEQKESLKTLFELPGSTLDGPYQPLTSVADVAGVEGSRRLFARRGHDRDMSINEIEEAQAAAEVRVAAEAKKPTKKAGKAASEATVD